MSDDTKNLADGTSTTPAPIRLGCRNLKSAPIFWGKKELIVELRKQRRIGYHDFTLGAVLGRETEECRWRDPFCRVLDVLRRDLIQMLCRGYLQAYAFVEGCDPSVARTPVHQGLWRVLRPDWNKLTAEGAGNKLFEITVCSPGCGRAQGQGEVASVGGQDKAATAGSASPTLALCPQRSAVLWGGQEANLPARPFQLLRLLFERALGAQPIVPTHTIRDALFGNTTSEKAPYDLVKRLRNLLAKLNIKGVGGRDVIQTVHNQGFRLDLDPKQIRID